MKFLKSLVILIAALFGSCGFLERTIGPHAIGYDIHGEGIVSVFTLVDSGGKSYPAVGLNRKGQPILIFIDKDSTLSPIKKYIKYINQHVMISGVASINNGNSIKISREGKLVGFPGWRDRSGLTEKERKERKVGYFIGVTPKHIIIKTP